MSCIYDEEGGEEVPDLQSDLELLTITIANDLQDIRAVIEKYRQQKEEIVKLIVTSQRPVIPANLEFKGAHLQISHALAMAISYIGIALLDQAARECRRALKIAQELEHETSIARCYYWMGRVELERQNLSASHKYFDMARACVMDEQNSEGTNWRFYWNITKPTLSEEFRKRLLFIRNTWILDSVSESLPGPVMVNIRTSMKRKREDSWEPALRNPFTSRNSKPQSIEDCQTKRKGSILWMVGDTEDIRRYSGKAAVKTDRNTSANLDLEWEGATKNGRRFKGIPFTFRKYPKGLACRTRLMNIFAEMPNEGVLSANQWKSLDESSKNLKTTMRYLAEESAALKSLNWQRSKEYPS